MRGKILYCNAKNSISIFNFGIENSKSIPKIEKSAPQNLKFDFDFQFSDPEFDFENLEIAFSNFVRISIRDHQIWNRNPRKPPNLDFRFKIQFVFDQNLDFVLGLFGQGPAEAPVSIADTADGSSSTSTSQPHASSEVGTSIPPSSPSAAHEQQSPVSAAVTTTASTGATAAAAAAAAMPTSRPTFRQLAAERSREEMEQRNVDSRARREGNADDQQECRRKIWRTKFSGMKRADANFG